MDLSAFKSGKRYTSPPYGMSRGTALGSARRRQRSSGVWADPLHAMHARRATADARRATRGDAAAKLDASTTDLWTRGWQPEEGSKQLPCSGASPSGLFWIYAMPPHTLPTPADAVQHLQPHIVASYLWISCLAS